VVQVMERNTYVQIICSLDKHCISDTACTFLWRSAVDTRPLSGGGRHDVNQRSLNRADVTESTVPTSVLRLATMVKMPAPRSPSLPNAPITSVA
jgi:hypothetical protein